MDERTQSRAVLHDAWCTWLGAFKYDVFGTMTFRERQPTASQALRRTTRFLRRYFERYDQRRVQAFVAAEQHRSGAWHSHALIASGAADDAELELIREGLWRLAFEGLGRCSFERIREAERAHAYLAKYLFKADAVWHLFGSGRM